MKSEDESPSHGGLVRETKTAPLAGDRRAPQLYDSGTNKRHSQTQNMQGHTNQDRQQAAKHKGKSKSKTSSDEQLEAELADYANDNGNERVKAPEPKNYLPVSKPAPQKRDSLGGGSLQAGVAAKPPKKLNTQGSTANDSKSSAGGKEPKQAESRADRNNSLNRTGGSQGASFKKKPRPEEVQTLNHPQNLASQKSGDKFIRPHFDSSEDEIEDLTEGRKNQFEDDPDYLDLTEDKPKLAAQPKSALNVNPAKPAPQPDPLRQAPNKPPIKNNIINKAKPEPARPAATKPPAGGKPPTTKPAPAKDREELLKKPGFLAKAPLTQPKKFQSQEDVHRAEDGFEDYIDDKSGPSEHYEEFDDHVPITSPSEGHTDKNFFDDEEEPPKKAPAKQAALPIRQADSQKLAKEEQKKEHSRVTQPDSFSSAPKNSSPSTQAPPKIVSLKQLKSQPQNKPQEPGQAPPGQAAPQIPAKLIERMNKALQHNPPKEGEKLDLRYKEIIKDAYRSFDGVKMTSTILNIDIDEMSYCFSQAILTHLRNYMEMQLVGESSPDEDYESSMDYYQRKVEKQFEEEDRAAEGKQEDGVVFDESLGIGDSQNLSRNNSVALGYCRIASEATARPSSATARATLPARCRRWQASAR